jgi:hypothetical protein
MLNAAFELPRMHQPVEKRLYAPSEHPSRTQKPCHCSVLALLSKCLDAVLDYPPVLQRLFQQCTMTLAGPPRSHENGSVAWLTSAQTGAIHTRERARSTV